MNEPISEIAHWIIKGDHDLGTAKLTFSHIPEFMDTVTFHCQQATEKYLKAYLIALSIPFKYTHDLVYLLDLITQKDSDFDIYYDMVSELQGYAIEVRYPNETVCLTSDKVEIAITTAKTVRAFITGKLNLIIDYNSIIDLN